MIKINIDMECYGCGVCVKSCPRKCIKLQENDKGFFKANIDESMCIGCNICDRYCIASHKNRHDQLHAIKAMYGYNLDPQKRNDGTSGGVFYEIATNFLREGALVCGCVWDEKWNPVHVLTDKIEIVEKMQRSKYAQSDIYEVLDPIKVALEAGNKVLFSGTPCQISALKKYVGAPDNLFCVGLVCHGVASRKVWQKYISVLKEKYGNIKKIRMREKNGIPWEKLSLYLEFEDGRTLILSKPENGQFMQAFQERLFVSERCMTCQFKGDSIEADIIIGDGWGQNETVKSMEDGKGISCILLLTNRGVELWDKVKSNFLTHDTTTETIVRGNSRLISPARRNKRSEKFYDNVDAGKKVDETLIEKYLYKNSFEAKLKKTIKSIIKKISYTRRNDK